MPQQPTRTGLAVHVTSTMGCRSLFGMTPRRATRSGRVTPKKADREGVHGHSTKQGRPSTAQATKPRAQPPQAKRYTPPQAAYRIRPRWHRPAGWLGIILGVAIAIANDAMIFVDGLTLLPMGHQELYLLLGVIVAGSSTWFLGLFDRGATIYE